MAEIPRPNAEVSTPLFDDDLLRQLAGSLNIYENPQEEVKPELEAQQPHPEVPQPDPQPEPLHVQAEEPQQPAAPIQTPATYPEGEGEQKVRVHGKINRDFHSKAIRTLVLGRIDDAIEEEAHSIPSEPVKPVKGGTASLYDETVPHTGKFALQKKDSDETYQIGKFLRVGRDPKYATLIPEGNTTISGKHAELFEKGGVLLVKDVGTHGDGSQNGTFINGNRIPPQISVEVMPGDVIKFSDEEYVVLAIE